MKKLKTITLGGLTGLMLAASLATFPKEAEAGWLGDAWDIVSGWFGGGVSGPPFIGYSNYNCQYANGQYEDREQACESHGNKSANVEGDGAHSCANCP